MPSRHCLKILHTSDVHLDAYGGGPSPYWGQRRRLIEEAFVQSVRLAYEQRVNLFLIAGDFFDSNRPADRAVAFALGQLRQIQAPVVILPGNHDCYSPDSVYRKIDFERECGNVRVITATQGQRLLIHELDLAIWGKADTGDENFRPLRGLAPREDERWYVAIAHGDYVPLGTKPSNWGLIPPRDIGADLDYLALGHWEKFADISQNGVTAVYSGAPMPLVDRLDSGGQVVIAELHEGRTVNVRRVDLIPPR